MKVPRPCAGVFYVQLVKMKLIALQINFLYKRFQMEFRSNYVAIKLFVRYNQFG